MRLRLAATSVIRCGFLHALLPHPSLLMLSSICNTGDSCEDFGQCSELHAGLCTSSRLDSRSLLSTVQLWLMGATRDVFVLSFRCGPRELTKTDFVFV
ncbi:hypothetical protein JB92DRAFT_2949335 [Gautieria morchelliformis]|nr:hypothetical protein JB92DRAFT_2949335 [Gautieria morchelliformis]